MHPSLDKIPPYWKEAERTHRKVAQCQHPTRWRCCHQTERREGPQRGRQVLNKLPFRFLPRVQPSCGRKGCRACESNPWGCPGLRTSSYCSKGEIILPTHPSRGLGMGGATCFKFFPQVPLNPAHPGTFDLKTSLLQSRVGPLPRTRQ